MRQLQKKWKVKSKQLNLTYTRKYDNGVSQSIRKQKKMFTKKNK